VPEELVGEVRRFIENGRALQDLLMQAGPCYVKALKRARKGTGNRNQGRSRGGPAARQMNFADVELMRQGVRLELLLEAIAKFLDSRAGAARSGASLKKPHRDRRGLTAPQVLRSLVLMRAKNWDYRELRERIAVRDQMPKPSCVSCQLGSPTTTRLKALGYRSPREFIAAHARP
jgi:hypothetical protein